LLDRKGVGMMRQKTIAVVILACVLAASVVYLVIPSTRPTSRCPIQPDTRIVVYGGTNSGQAWPVGGVSVVTYGWIKHFFDWWESYDPAVKYVFLNSTNLKSDCHLSDYPNVRLYVQPGGDAYYQQLSLGVTGKSNILDFLDRGGSYLGICAGWYYAAKDYYWAGDYYNWPDLLGRFPTVEGSITDIAEYPAYNMTSLSNGLDMIYYGGPTRGWKQTPNETPGTVLMTFANIPGNLPAAVKVNKMLLLSVHPEAYEDYRGWGLTTEQRIANYKWLANAINNVAGTQFTVPQATSVSALGSSQQMYAYAILSFTQTVERNSAFLSRKAHYHNWAWESNCRIVLTGRRS
jgi:hypothetical protein